MGGAEQGQRSWRTSHEALEHHPNLNSPNAIWPVLNFSLYSKVLVPQRATGIIRQSTGWRSDQTLKRNESVTIHRQKAEFSAWHSSSPSRQCPESPASASVQEGTLSPHSEIRLSGTGPTLPLPAPPSSTPSSLHPNCRLEVGRSATTHTPTHDCTCTPHR